MSDENAAPPPQASSAADAAVETATDTTDDIGAAAATIDAAAAAAADVETPANVTVPKPSGIKPPAASRIGRPCTGHATPKAGPPPLNADAAQTDPIGTMRRQPDEYSRSSHLSDVYEESEAELLSEDRTDRASTKSRSPADSAASSLVDRSSHKGAGDRRVSSASFNSEHYLEATGKRRSSDQSVVLTADTDSFIIGQRIWVGGQRPGHIAYIGETHFAPGDWAGIVLDEPSGKNDGCVSGKRYFQCEPKRGIFSRLTRLTREPLSGAGDGADPLSSSFGGAMQPPSPTSRSGAVSPSQSVRSYATGMGMGGRTPGKGNLSVGDRIIVSSGLGSRPGILKYLGETHFASGNWCGVQLDEPSGKNDGSVDGKRYFECSPNYGIFVPIAKVSLSPSSRKARLSRAGSKESLTSVGTVGSMASTVTSRMRQSGVQQRLSTPAKPLTTSKNTVALQDILREKQNHIEQLLLERETEKQESETQIIAYQRDINQLNEQLATLKKSLTIETKRSEDLQVSIEEATFCGDELNAQTQDYRERIARLEEQLATAQTTTNTNHDANAAQHQTELRQLADSLAQKTAALDAAEAELQQRTADLTALGERFKDTESDWTIKLSSLGVSEQCLREEIKFLHAENEQLKTELRDRDAATEKEYLSMRHIENELKEELQAIQAQLQQRDAQLTDNDGALQRLVAERDAQIAELRSAATGTKDVHQLEANARAAELHAAHERLAEVQQAEQRVGAERDALQAELELQRDEIAAHKQTICETSAQVAKLQSEAADAQTRGDTQTHKLQEHTETVQRLRDEVAALQATDADWTTRFANLQHANSNLSDVVVREKDDRIAELSQAIEAKGAVVLRLTEGQVRLEAQVEGLRTELANKEAQNGELRKNGERVAAELERLQAERHRDAAAAGELRERIAGAEQRVSDGAAQTGTLRQEIDALQRTIAELRAQNDELREQLNVQANALNDSVSEAAAQNDEKTNLQQTIARLQQDLDSRAADVKKSQAKLGELSDKLDQSRDAGNATETQLAELQIEHGDVVRQRAHLEQKLHQTLAEKASLQQNLDALQSASSDTSSEVHRLRDELQQRSVALSALTDRSSGAQLALERRQHELQQELAARGAQFDRVREELDALSAQKIERENELNLELCRAKEASEGVRESLVNDCNALRAQFAEDRDRTAAEHAGQLAQADGVQQELRENVAQLKMELARLTADGEKTRTERSAHESEAQSQIDGLQAAEKRLQAQLQAAAEAEQQLRNNLEENAQTNDETITKLTAQLEAASQQTSTFASIVETLRGEQAAASLASLAELESVRQTHADELARLQASIDTLTARNAALDEQFKTTEDDQVDLVNKNLEMVEELQLLKQQLGESDERGAEVAAHLETSSLKLIELQASLETATRSHETAELALAEERTTAATLLQQTDDLRSQLAAKSTEHSDAKAALTAALADCAAVRSDAAAAASEARTQIEAFEERLLQLTATSGTQSDGLRSELNAKDELLRSKDARLEALNAAIAELQAQHDDDAAAQKTAAAAVARLEDKLERTERSHRDAVDAAAELRLAELDAQRAESARLMAEWQQRLDSGAEYVSLAQLGERVAAVRAEHADVVAAMQRRLDERDAVAKTADKELEYAKVALQRREEQLVLENQRLTERLKVAQSAEGCSKAAATSSASSAGAAVTDDSGAQIAFLNSIIADMQKKNELLLLRISALETSPQDFIKNSLYDVPIRREPAPRLFCDICDVFDEHETEDCPLQSSGTPSPPPSATHSATKAAAANGKDHKIQPPRKYCETCEVFGHEASECEVDDTY